MKSQRKVRAYEPARRGTELVIADLNWALLNMRKFNLVIAKYRFSCLGTYSLRATLQKETNITFDDL